MKHWLIAWAVFLGLLAPAAAFWQSRDSNYDQNVVSGGGGGSSVAIDVIGTQKYQASSGSFNYTGLTTGTPTNLGLVCVWIRDDGANNTLAGAAATWNGVAMTVVSSVISATNAAIIFGLHNPASGARTLALSATNSAADNFVNCVSLGNVNQTSDAVAFPNGTSLGPGNPTLTVTSAAGHMAIGGIINQNGSAGSLLGTTVLFDAINGSLINAASDAVASTGSSTIVGMSAGSAGGIVGVDVSN